MYRKHLLLAFIFLVLVSLFGCVVPKIKRGVGERNIFYCTHSPNIQIQVGKDLKYVGKCEYEVTRKGPDVAAGIIYESYFFIKGERTLDKGVAIYFTSIVEDGITYTGPTGGDKVKINGKEYRSYFYRSLAKKAFNIKEKQLIASSGILLDKTYVLRKIARRIRDDMMFFIVYFERYEDYMSKYNFLARSEQAYRILAGDEKRQITETQVGKDKTVQVPALDSASEIAKDEQLEKERPELEQIKSLKEERKKLEIARKRLESERLKIEKLQDYKGSYKRNANTYKMAIFPWKIQNSTPYLMDRSFFETVSNVIANSDNIEIKYSSFKYNKYTNNTLELIDKDTTKKIWRNWTTPSLTEQEIEFVIDYGGRLNVDLVLMVSIVSTVGQYTLDMRIYLVDIKNKKVYKEKKRAGYTHFIDELKNATQKALDSFLNLS